MISKTITCLLVLASFTASINGQTCQGISQYSPCSANSACGCLYLTLANSTGICGLVDVNCARLAPCMGPYDTCSGSDSICIRHPRCGGGSVCYPLAMIDQRLCPSTTGSNFTSPYGSITSSYSSYLSYYGDMYSRNESSASRYYYEAVRVVANTAGTYNISSISGMHTIGSLYQGAFYSYVPSMNLLAQDEGGAGGQFLLSPYLQTGVTYILVVTTYSERVTGPFSITATGPGSLMFLTSNTTMQMSSPWYMNSTMPMYSSWSMYNSTYWPMYNSSSWSMYNSTYWPMYNSSSWSMYNSSSWYPGNNGSSTLQQYATNATHSSSLTMNSPLYSRTDNSVIRQYYEAIRVIVPVTGAYMFTSASNMDTYGYLYQGAFDPSRSSANVRAFDDDNGGNGQFRVTDNLEAGVSYTLVVTTFGELVTGPFSIIVSGPRAVTFLPANNTMSVTTSTMGMFNGSMPSNTTTWGMMNSSMFWSTTMGSFNRTMPMNTTTWGMMNSTMSRSTTMGSFNRTMPTNTTTGTGFNGTSTQGSPASNYSGSLSSSSGAYARPGGSGSRFYYQAMPFSVSSSGTYSFSSISNMDTYGSLYDGSFPPSTPTVNLLSQDDDTAGNSQFRITASLQSGRTYTVVLTTFNEQVTGPFSIATAGPGAVRFQ